MSLGKGTIQALTVKLPIGTRSLEGRGCAPMADCPAVLTSTCSQKTYLARTLDTAAE